MKLVTRSGWKARGPKCSEPVPAIDALVVHYSASNADELADHANCAGRVRAIQNYHMDSRDYCDIAYNFLFCKHGYIFEGRGWARKAGATGAANSHTVAVCFLGDDTAGRDDVTRAGRVAVADWLRAAEKHYPGAQAVKGHRDFMPTSCPGNELYNWVRTGAWRTLGLPRYRYELWARKKGKPALLVKSASFLPENAEGRAKKFLARVSARYAVLLATGRRPRIRKVEV